MTLKPIESEFSELLLEHSKAAKLPINLQLNSLPVEQLTPKVLWEKLQAERHIESNLGSITLPGWNYQCFANMSEALNLYPNVYKIQGRPYEVYKLLQSELHEALIDFAPLGSVFLSKNDVTPLSSEGLFSRLLPVWLSYALSPELWGENGKWRHFHSRLHQLFHETNLLNGDDFPGYYPLKEEAGKLAQHGFIGSELENSYVLVLPWSFPLSALQKLEEVIRQEF